MRNILEINVLSKTYENGFSALSNTSLNVKEGEILALLGPNGAGKTTLISAICGISVPTSGQIKVGGFDIQRQYREARKLIGLVPQEITLEPFEKVINTIRFSRGLFGKPKDDAYVEKVLRSLSLWDKKDSRIMQLSGGMKRRVLIAKALAHEPRLLFLDEPTAGVDVELRQSMWAVVEELRKDGVTIILTTHYIEEAEAIADRIAVIAKGSIRLVEEKAALMKRLGQKSLTLELQNRMEQVPEGLSEFRVVLSDDGTQLIYEYDTQAERTGIARLMAALGEQGIVLKDLQTNQSSLEDIFVKLLKEGQQ
ncbi:MAG: ABC transporter ATP-binding protein [Rhodobacteraceae bacterium]|nr:ABC transporter ATP-binding protein [Paracoccaceae bacterium]NDI13888.1 ABC transporter ATP-binding protein [Paracoccaceae bacterium]